MSKCYLSYFIFKSQSKVEYVDNLSKIRRNIHLNSAICAGSKIDKLWR